MKIFWAWQSDTDQKVGRYLVRDALDAAIQRLKEANEIEEPAEQTRLQDIHLDYDTKDLSGSPDIVAAIFDKIASAAVFVGDVTPVGKTPTKVIAGKRHKAKPLMNPNVAVELGYAIGRLDLSKILMVFNTAYGNPGELPFDLRSKRGPIPYNLPEGSEAEAVASARKELTDKLVIALKPFLVAPAPILEAPFEETATTYSKALFFKHPEKIGVLPNRGISFTVPFKSLIYLRLIPARRLPMPIAVDTLKNNVGRYGAFGDASGVYVLENPYGYAVIRQAGDTNNADNLVQYFRNGEIWGINADILRQGERGQERWLPSYQLGRVCLDGLTQAASFVKEVSKVSPPYTVEVGVVNVKNRKLIINNQLLSQAGIMYSENVFLRKTLSNLEKRTQDEFMLEFFEMVHADTGVPRPHKLYQFPNW
jgi:hypothetical protein